MRPETGAGSRPEAWQSLITTRRLQHSPVSAWPRPPSGRAARHAHIVVHLTKYLRGHRYRDKHHETIGERQMQFRTEERSFSAAEVARLTGTSQDQQRDWRRHGFLPRTAPGRRARFSLLELCIIALVKVQTDAGKAVSGAFTVAKFTAPILYTQVELCPLAVRIEGAELKPRDRGGLLRALAEIGEDEEPSRYVFFPVADPEPSPLAPDPEFLEDEDRLAGAYVLGSLQDVEKCIPHAWTYGTIFDLESFAMKLALQVREPLITYFRKADSK